MATIVIETLSKFDENYVKIALAEAAARSRQTALLLDTADPELAKNQRRHAETLERMIATMFVAATTRLAIQKAMVAEIVKACKPFNEQESPIIDNTFITSVMKTIDSVETERIDAMWQDAHRILKSDVINITDT